MTTTVGKILLKKYLPQDLHDIVDSVVLDKKGITKLFSTLAEKYPNTYGQVVSDLTRLGFEISTRAGSSISLKDLVSPIDKEEEYNKLDKKVEAIKDQKLPKTKENDALFNLYSSFTSDIDKKILVEGVKQNRTLAKIIVAGSRGSPAQYRATVATQGIVSDQDQKPLLEIPVKSSFAEGLTVPEYLAHTYGARAGTLGTKLSVADSGFSSKQLSRASMTLIVEEHDCNTDNGLSVSVSDKDSVGCFLAHPIGGYNKNNEITVKLLSELANKHIEEIVIRSPITCQSSKTYHFGAVCQLCCGNREKGLPAIGSYIGILSASTLGERLSQSTLNSKHQGSAAAKNPLSGGFKTIDQLFNIPKTFNNKAAVASLDGIITSIKPSSAGGSFIHVNTTEHYVPTDFAPIVKVGDRVEAGDVLSEGIVNPAEVVHYKGIGEGRKYFVDTMKKVFENSGMSINRRNFEVIARAAMDHVKITNPEGLGDYLPDQIVSYQTIEKNYKARPDSKSVRIDHALGLYLEQPVLHFTIGTRITTRVISELEKHKIDSVVVNNNPPGFEPMMVRLLDVPKHVPDWAHQLYSIGLEQALVNAVNKGIANTSSIKGPSPILGLGYAKGFGEKS